MGSLDEFSLIHCFLWRATVFGEKIKEGEGGRGLGLGEIDSHMELCKSRYDTPESPSDFSKTICWGFPEEQIGMGRGSGCLPPQMFHGYSMGTSWMDPPYVFTVGGGGGGRTSSDAGQLGGGSTLGSSQGSKARNCGICVCVAASFRSVASCQLGRSLKARNWLNWLSEKEKSSIGTAFALDAAMTVMRVKSAI